MAIKPDAFCTVGAKGKGRHIGGSNLVIMEKLTRTAYGVCGSVTGAAKVFQSKANAFLKLLTMSVTSMLNPHAEWGFLRMPSSC